MTGLMRAMRLVLAAMLLLAGALPAAEPPRITIDFAPAAAEKMDTFGEEERGPLQAAIRAALERETAKVPTAAGVQIAVTVEDLAPTHPTRAQLAADPAASAAQSKFLGGAALSAELRDANHHVLKAVNHNYSARTLGLGSSSLDPWADARLAIDQFAVKVAAACRDLPKS
jgi:hypothetical protein